MSRWGKPSAGPPGSCLPIVIYIAGSGRSGSTMLERVLGEMPGFVNVGELIDLFRRTAPRGERCGCGLAFADCPFWIGVGERAFGGWDGDQLAPSTGCSAWLRGSGTCPGCSPRGWLTGTSGPMWPPTAPGTAASTAPSPPSLARHTWWTRASGRSRRWHWPGPESTYG